MTSLPTAQDFARWYAQRRPLQDALTAEGTTFFRGLHLTETSGLLTLDVAGNVGILSLYAPLTPPQETHVATLALDTWGLHSLYLKRRPQEARHLANVQREYLSPAAPLLGPEVNEVTVLERGVPFVIRPGGDLSTGLFSDARPARAWVHSHAAGRRMLNTFAYTCGFGLSAALGGATSTKNLDLSRKVLAWGKENYALSGLNPDGSTHDFVYGDTFDWLRRLYRRGEQFDLVVLDPPSFARSKRGVWRSDHDYAQLIYAALNVSAPGGQIVALCNHAGLSSTQFERMLRLGCEQAQQPFSPQTRLGAGPDYPGAQHLKGVVIGVAP